MAMGAIRSAVTMYVGGGEQGLGHPESAAALRAGGEEERLGFLFCLF